MVFKQIYLVIRHFLPTILMVIVGSVFLTYFQAETILTIISIVFFSWLQPFIDKFREVGHQIKHENRKTTQESLPKYYESSPALQGEDEIILPPNKKAPNALSKFPWQGLSIGAVKVISSILGIAGLLFFLAFLYMYFFFYP